MTQAEALVAARERQGHVTFRDAKTGKVTTVAHGPLLEG
jgi:hypothetical protein